MSGDPAIKTVIRQHFPPLIAGDGKHQGEIIGCVCGWDSLACSGGQNYGEHLLEAARPIIMAEALRKAADVIGADDFEADDPDSHDPDYWGGFAVAAGYLRRAAEEMG